MNIGKQKGYTLLELMLVLSIITGFAIVRIQDMQFRAEQTKAKSLGVQMFQYNNAVRSYISNNPGVAIVPPTGTDWLKPVTCGGTSAIVDYLPCNFPDTTVFDQTYSTTITVVGGFTTGTTLLDPLVDDRGVRADLSGLAALVASGGSVNSLVPVWAATNAAFSSNINTAVITLLASTNPSTDAWLRSDGSNTMNNAITFNSAIAAANREILNLRTIRTVVGENLDIDTAVVWMTGSLGVNQSLAVGVVDQVDVLNPALFDQGDLAVGGDAFIDETIKLDGINIKKEVDIVGNDSLLVEAPILASYFTDRDDQAFFVDPNGESSLNSVTTVTKNMFGVCNAGDFDTQCREGDITKGFSSKGTAALLKGFVDVDKLYVKKHYSTAGNLNVAKGQDIVLGSSAQRDWRWVSLQRLLPNFVHMGSYLVTRTQGTPPVGSARPQVPKPRCGTHNSNGSVNLTTSLASSSLRKVGVERIILSPIQIPVNIRNDCLQFCDGVQGDLAGGFLMRAVNAAKHWEIDAYSLTAPASGANVVLLAQTYCYYGNY